MKRLFVAAASLLSASAILCGAVQADLGAAEDGDDNNGLSGVVYQPWCGYKSNTKCNVKFENDRLIVNNGSGITASQLQSITVKWQKFYNHNKDENNPEHGERCLYPIKSCQLHFRIQYKDTSGRIRNALIRFRWILRSQQFQDDIEEWSGMKYRVRNALQGSTVDYFFK